ncbi:response regulator [Thermotoga neapolitana DSM 4359]|uniref:Response regulator n=2 Tax=Thermotogaceae TaxID=188709 RepID=B9K706_THENN|nr:Response regulator [Thermotoga neapolitana DSM 4359]AJG40683.1 transcriptional regulator [Thermotoga sp. RQ7]KFZ22363.1 Response regulator [Thermotoga neapolitana LA10]HBF10815.1 DNA-binding response regulator [Thermotoga neapolitana]
MMWKIAVVDDDGKILEILSVKLSKLGHVETFLTGEDFLNSEEIFHVVVLDVKLPDYSGYELCRMIKEEHPETWVILLTLLSDDESVLKGFEAGADDYVTKPFNPDILLARVKRFLERQKKNLYDFGELKVDATGATVYLKGKRIHLPRREFEILLFLVENAGKVVTREKLLETFWEEPVSPRAVDTVIKRIRKAIEDDPNRPRYIKTVWGIGYTFVGGER